MPVTYWGHTLLAPLLKLNSSHSLISRPLMPTPSKKPSRKKKPSTMNQKIPRLTTLEMDRIAEGVFASVPPGTPPDLIQAEIDRLVKEGNEKKRVQAATDAMNREKNAVRKVSTRQLFIARMRRAGKGPWIDNRYLELRLGGTAPALIWPTIMKELAFPGKKAELLIEEQCQKEFVHTVKSEAKTEKVTIAEEKRIMTFEEAVKTLPIKSSPKEDMDWIRSHTAMLRYNQLKDKTKQVTISIDDILHADHGPAPSRAAVVSLQHWVNYPNEFHKQIIGVHKRAEEEAGSATGAAKPDLGVAEIERLLDGFINEDS